MGWYGMGLPGEGGGVGAESFEEVLLDGVDGRPVVEEESVDVARVGSEAPEEGVGHVSSDEVIDEGVHPSLVEVGATAPFSNHDGVSIIP